MVAILPLIERATPIIATIPVIIERGTPLIDQLYGEESVRKAEKTGIIFKGISDILRGVTSD
jgi:hypothetical protein